MAHDLGTSSDKAVLVDFNGNIVATASESYPTFYPKPAWVEQDARDYWESSCRASKRIMVENGIEPSDVQAVIFSTQAQGIIPVDKKGNVLHKNITWVDGRAEKQARDIMNRVGGKRIFTLFSGTPIMGKDVLAKVMWLKEEEPEIWAKTYKILDVNGYMRYMSTGGMYTEISGASSFALDLKKKEWMSVLKLVGLDMEKLPPLCNSTDDMGGLLPEAAEKMGLSEGIPVFGGCDDVQAAAVGSGMCEDGDAHIYLGTSAWVAVATKDKDKFKRGAAPIQSADKNMLLIAGITESAGANLLWLQEKLYPHELEKYGDRIFDFMDEEVATVPPGSDDLIFTPWMLGERCPVSSTTTRATFFNLSMDHTRAHMLRALYEGIGFNLRWIMENYKQDYGFRFDNLSIIGGGAMNGPWMQIIADITGKEFSVPVDPKNSGALGAAAVAMIGLGEIDNFAKVKDFVKIERTYTPDPENKAVYDKLFEDYKNIYRGLKSAYEIANSARFTRSV